MKRLFCLCFMFLSLGSSMLYAQIKYSQSVLDNIGLPYDEQTRMITYSGVINVDDMPHEMLYEKIKDALILRFSNIDFPVLIDKKDEGTYVIRGIFQDMVYRSNFLFFINNEYYNLIFTLKIDTKDNKFRYTMTDFLVYYKEKEGITQSQDIYWGYGFSSGHTKEYKVPEIPLEDFFKRSVRRRSWGRMYPDFQDRQKEFIADLEKNVKASKKDDDW